MQVSGEKKTIVLVDDDASMSQALELMLRAGGYEVVTFASAEAAHGAAAATTASCLVLDIFLPGISGFELYRQLVQCGSSAPVIFVTAHDEPALREEAGRLGASSFLRKPFPGRMLLDAVARALISH
jgi:FixJ family two-component response regulator